MSARAKGEYVRVYPSTAGEERAAAWLEAHRARPPMLRALLHAMPKGGDIHTHLSGAVYAESGEATRRGQYMEAQWPSSQTHSMPFQYQVPGTHTACGYAGPNGVKPPGWLKLGAGAG